MLYYIENSELTQNKQIPLNSNNLFAFPDEHLFLEGIPNEEIFNPNDTFYLSRNSNFSNLGDSNFFSTFGDKSLFFKQLNDTEKQIEDDNKSVFTVDLDLERQVNLLTDDDDEDDILNEAKINFGNEWSSNNSYFLNSNNQHNMTTPVPQTNNIFYPTIESEDKYSNNNINNTNLATTNCTSLANNVNFMNNNCVVKNKLKLNSDKNEKHHLINNNNVSSSNNTINTIGSNSKITNIKVVNNKNNNLKGNMIDYKDDKNFINLTQSTPSFDLHSNSVDLHSINLISGYYYNQTPNNSIYNNNFYRNIRRHNKYQQNFSSYINNCYMSNYSQSCQSSSNIRDDSKNRSRNYNYNEKMKIMLKDQNGSKYIQKKIEEKSPEFLHKLYEQIKNNLFDIITDQYGNYVIQKFVDFCDKKQISVLLKQLSLNNKNNINTLYEISINNYGTRAIQKIFENLSDHMTEEDIQIILKFIKGNVSSLIKNINGNRVIQSVIENIKNKSLLSPIYKEMNENLLDIITTKSGCCVFSKILLNINDEDFNSMIDIIIANKEKLINDEYGNFILQRIIKLGNAKFNEKIFNFVKNNILAFSCQKFSSNVVESCIGGDPPRQDVIDKLIEKNNINQLILDQYGNYIVQNALEKVNEKDFEVIIKHIKESVDNLKKTVHGKKIYDKLVKNYRHFLFDDSSSSNSGSRYINNKKYGVKNKNRYGGKKNKK